MDQAKMDKVLGLREDLRIFEKGKAMQILVYEDNVIKLAINNDNCKRTMHTTFCNISQSCPWDKEQIKIKIVA